jgi:hypothetical protein
VDRREPAGECFRNRSITPTARSLHRCREWFNKKDGFRAFTLYRRDDQVMLVLASPVGASDQKILHSAPCRIKPSDACSSLAQSTFLEGL